jgi:hypothetical protein
MATKPVFIQLLHGRDDPAKDMDDWGFSGPVLGPFISVRITYKEHICCLRDDPTRSELDLHFVDDLLTYEGKFYGDFEICGGHDPA